MPKNWRLSAFAVAPARTSTLPIYTNANLPVWAFHAQDDGTVGAGCTTGAITAINNQNPVVKPYMTIWPTGQHWIWGRVYDTEYNWQNPNLYEWFLGQNKSLPPNKRPVANAGNPLSILSTLGIVTLKASWLYRSGWKDCTIYMDKDCRPQCWRYQRCSYCEQHYYGYRLKPGRHLSV